MLKCSHCQWENHDAAQFCANCGNRLTAADFARPAPDAWPTQQPQAADWAVAVEEKNAAAMRLVAEGKLSEALEALNEAIRLAPNHAPSYLNRADVLARLGMMSQAEADRRMAQQLAQPTAYTPPPAYGPPAPEQAAATYASFGMRFGAWLIDLVIAVAVYLLTSVVVGFIIGASMGLDATDEELNDAVDKAVIILVVAIGAAWALYLWLANSWGGTLGKRALGLRVVSASDGGTLIGPLRGLVRYFVYLIGSIPVYLGWFWMLWDNQKQTWHDKAAGSIVVRTR